MVQNTSRSDPGQVVGDSTDSLQTGQMDSSDTLCGCTWNGFTLCSRLQSLAKPHLFLIVLILQGIVQEVSESFYLKTILSTKFVVPYTTTRWLLLGSELVLLLLAILIIYWGSERRLPGWLAGCTVFLSICSILFATQLLSEYSSNVSDNSRSDTDSGLCQTWSQTFSTVRWKWNWITVSIIPVLYFAIRMCGIAYWAFGISYIDNNSVDNMSPLFIGVALALKQFGAFIGSFVSSVSFTIFRTGIFWLIIGGVVLIVAILIGMFPKRLPGSIINQTGDSGLIVALQRILSNKIILFSGLAAISLLTFVINATAIEEKYVESTFYISGSYLFDSIFSIQYLFSILKPSVAAIALLISGIVIYQMKPRAAFLCIWSIVCICIAAAAMFAIIFFKCSETPIHRGDSRNNLEEHCNVNCGCSEDTPFMPACSQYFPFVYYSPCHAGCSSSYIAGNTKVYSNCKCVPTRTVEVGHCSGGKCRVYWLLFQVLVLVATAFLASGIIGNLFICLRCILPRDKTIMIGFIFTIASFIARVPNKIVYDLIASWSCLYYVDSQCKIYDSDKLATYINLFHSCILLSAAGMLTITCFLVQDLPLYGNPSAAKDNSELGMTEMTDFRSQLNQALKARRESSAEEQKLLSESTTHPSHLQGHENGNRASFIEDSKQNPSINGQKKHVLQKPLIPVKTPIVKNDTNNTDEDTTSITPSSERHSITPSPTQKPVVPVKSAALVNEIKASFSNSANSTPPSSPTHSAGTTVRSQGYLTTLL